MTVYVSVLSAGIAILAVRNMYAKDMYGLLVNIVACLLLLVFVTHGKE